MAFFKKESKLCFVSVTGLRGFFTTMANCLFAELEQSCHKPSAYTKRAVCFNTGAACVYVRAYAQTAGFLQTQNHRYMRGKNVNIFAVCKLAEFLGKTTSPQTQTHIKWLLLSKKWKKNFYVKSDSLDKNETNYEQLI